MADSLTSPPLTTLGLIKGKRGLDLSTSDWDSALEDWIEAASQLIVDGIGRHLHRVDGHTEKVGSRGGPTLRVHEHLPVREIDKVEYDGDLVDAADYRLETPSEGELEHEHCWRDTSYRSGAFGDRQSPRPPEKLYEVTYSGGYVTRVQDPYGSDNESRDLPPDIEEAIVDYCVMKYAQQGKDPTVTREKLGSASMSWGEVNGRRVPASLADVVDRYRKPGVS